MALWAKHCNKVAVARTKFPAKMDEEAKAKSYAIQKQKSDHEEKIMQLFFEKHTTMDDIKSVTEFDKDAEWNSKFYENKAEH
eukprot:10723384-Heterocapsa_arctica.AAC.1